MMGKKNRKKILLATFFGGIIFVLSGIIFFKKYNNNSEGEIKSTVALYGSQLYSQVIEKYSNYDWAQEKDPKLLMLYSLALIETGRSLPASLNSTIIPSNIADFINGFFLLLQGEVLQATNIFENLTKQPEGKVLGYIGLLEKAFYTENITSMKYHLDKLRLLKEKDVWEVDWAIPYYSIIYYYHMAQYNDAKSLLYAVGSNENQWFNDYIAIIKINILLRENRIGEARDVLNKAFVLYGVTQDLILSEANILLLEAGYKVSSQYLKEKINEFPIMWKIKQQYAFHYLEDAQESAVQESVKIIRKIVSVRSFDIQNLIIVTDSLLEMGAFKDAGELLTNFDKLSYAPTYFALYNLLMAKIDYVSSRKNSFQINIDEANKMSPMNPSILWFVYRVARKQNQYEKAFEALNKLLHVDPYNQTVLTSLAEIYIEQKKWDKVTSVADKLFSTKRHINYKLAEQMKMYAEIANKKHP